MADAPRKIHLLKQNDCHPLFPTGLWNGFWKWEIVAGRSQFWLYIGNSFSDLLFIAFVIAIIHTGVPQKILPLCLIVKLKSLCSAHRERIWPCPLVNSYNKKKKLIHHFQRLALSGDVLQDCRPFLLYFFTASPLFCLLTSVPHCFSLSGSITEPGIQTPKDGYSETFSSVVQSCLTLCDPTDCSTPGFPDSWWPHRLQHTKLPFPSPSPRAYSNSCPSNWWCHPIISSSVVPFSSCLQSFPASGAFPIKTRVCHLLSQLNFWIKSYSLPQHIISWIHWSVMWWVEQTWTQ